MNTQLIVKKSMLVLLTLATLFSLVAPVMAREAEAASDKNKPVAPSQGRGPTDPAEMEAFMDELFARQLDKYHIAGAADMTHSANILHHADLVIGMHQRHQHGIWLQRVDYLLGMHNARDVGLQVSHLEAFAFELFECIKYRLVLSAAAHNVFAAALVKARRTE